MPKLTIDGKEVEVEAGTTVIRAAASADHSVLLLASSPKRRGKLPNVFGRGGKSACFYLRVKLSAEMAWS